MLLSVNICVILHTYKYHMKSLKNNTVKSKNTSDLFE